MDDGTEKGDREVNKIPYENYLQQHQTFKFLNYNNSTLNNSNGIIEQTRWDSPYVPKVTHIDQSNINNITLYIFI